MHNFDSAQSPPGFEHCTFNSTPTFPEMNRTINAGREVHSIGISKFRKLYIVNSSFQLLQMMPNGLDSRPI
uniref:Ovule protein n=1 Tax=Panagrellus redivivus TaxID=6233 RepID=A0A7E4W0Q0_PANRE